MNSKHLLEMQRSNKRSLRTFLLVDFFAMTLLKTFHLVLQFFHLVCYTKHCCLTDGLCMTAGKRSKLSKAKPLSSR